MIIRFITYGMSLLAFIITYHTYSNFEISIKELDLIFNANLLLALHGIVIISSVFIFDILNSLTHYKKTAIIMSIFITFYSANVTYKLFHLNAGRSLAFVMIGLFSFLFIIISMKLIIDLKKSNYVKITDIEQKGANDF